MWRGWQRKWMKIINENSSVWYERYKPQCIEDLILPESLKQQLQTSVKSQKYVESREALGYPLIKNQAANTAA